MAYSNFKPIIWSKRIEHQLPKFTVFEKDCDYRFKGDAQQGKTVKILGVTRPTIGDYTGDSIGAPETVPDISSNLLIDQAKFFNFMVDDVDEAQSVDGLMDALMEESTRAMAEERDKFIAKTCALGAGTKASASINSKASAKAAIDTALTTLWNNGVAQNDNITIYLSPAVYMYLADYIIETRTANDEAVATGLIGRYMGAQVKMSNNLYVDEASKTHLIVKTAKGCAFAGGINSVDAYRPEGLFSDAVKGLNTYGARVIRPKEVYAIYY